jgi:hypothetical protein
MKAFRRFEWEFNEENEAEHFRAVLGFSEELRVLMNHITSMLPRPWGVTSSIAEWFREITVALDEIENAVSNNWWETGSVTIDSVGVSELDCVLDNAPDLTTGFCKRAADRCAQKFLVAWLDEIQRRGREIISLAIMEVDVMNALDALNRLKGMRYPSLR